MLGRAVLVIASCGVDCLCGVVHAVTNYALPAVLQVAVEMAKFDKEPLMYVGRPVLVEMPEVMSADGRKAYNEWKPRFRTTLQARVYGWGVWILY